MAARVLSLAIVFGVAMTAPASGARAATLDASSATSVGEVVVTAPREEQKARIVQFQAPNLINVQSAETILKYPDFNAAEALGRMPGISLSSDTGEGRFVQIRGIDANLDGATYGGIPLLNTNPGGTAAGGGGRAVEFDTIPTGAVDGIIVTYTLLPDHEAEGLGGSIELTPRSAVNVSKPFFEGTLGWGYEPLHDHTGPFEADVAFGARFGFDDHGLVIENGTGGEAPRAGFISNPTPFSFVITASRVDDRRAVDDLEESYLDDGVAPSNGVSEYDLRRYDYHRRRFSYGGEFDFKPNEDHSYYIRAGVAGYTEAVHKNFLLFTNMSDPSADPSNPNVLSTLTNPDIALTDEEEVHRNQIYAIGGVDNFDQTVLDYHGAYSRATFHVRRNIGADFIAPTAYVNDPNAAQIPITYDNVSTPNYPIFTFPGGFNVNDASNYALYDLNNDQEYDVDEEYSGAVNLSTPLAFINGDTRLKIGAEVRLRDKTASEYDETYVTPTSPLLSLSGLSGPALSYYDNHYTAGPMVNLYAVRDLINSGATPSTGTIFNPTSYIAATENIFAGYGQVTTKVGKFGLLAGARVEATEATYGAYVQTSNADGSTTNTFLDRKVDYVNVFPTFQIRYDFTPRLLLRATYSSGIGRPGFEQNTTSASVDRTQSPLAISRGNPNLQPTYGNNFDLSLEYYLSNGGILSLAAFDKEFTNYIAERIYFTTTDPLAPGVLAHVTTYLNVNDAWARGIQAAYHQKFTFLPHPLQGFGIDANLTLVDSHILEYNAATSATGQNEYGLLPGTSQVTWNLAGFYEAYGFEARIAAEYVSHSLFGLGGDKSLDTIQDNRLTLDMSSSYKLDKHWTIYFEAKNLLNTPLRYYEGSSDRPLQREFYDITAEGGVRVYY